ncbi:MAG: NTP transferase domain-containing protein [Anaerolineae bacterium]|nr:NTP transferase domain-containing protein [Anaerolineae bacterium]
MQGIILAAGKGTRLYPLSLQRSKAMMPIVGKPIVERVMEMLLQNGVDDFILVVSPEDREITRYFQRESQIQAEVRFVYQAKRLGMAHALMCAAPLVKEDFVLSACDNLVPAEALGSVLGFWQHTPRPNGILTLLAVEPEYVRKGAIVKMEGPWITYIIEKPEPENAPSNMYSLPLYSFTPRILEYLPEVQPSPRGEYEIQDAIRLVIERDGYVGGVAVDRRVTLTNVADLLSLNRVYLAQESNVPQIAPCVIGAHTQLLTPLRIETGTIIGADCVIGPNVYIERDCYIEDGVTLQDAMVLRKTRVGAGETHTNTVVV